jgi:glycosyltransferase involved in cell wall biosynthesis
LLTGLSKYKQSKIVWHARDYLSNRHLMRKLIPLICNIPDVIITNSQSVKDDWINFIPHACYQVMHNTVSIPNPFECSKNNEGLFNGFENNRIRVGLVASYAKWKGHIVYLKAIAILVNDPRMIDCNFYVIGGPIYGTQGSQWSLEELEDKCRVLGIKERVFFIPHQESINFIYRNLDIIIHASTKPEPFGRTIIEGMAHGKAIVAARGGGVDEIITDGSDALGFDSGNEKDLAHNIKSLVVDEKLRNRLGDAGKEKVTSYFSTETGSRKVISLFENIARKQP